MVIRWQDPPAQQETKLEITKLELKRRPGDWALIVEESNSMVLLDWWNPLRADGDYELRLVPQTTGIYGPRDIYARYMPRDGK